MVLLNCERSNVLEVHAQECRRFSVGYLHARAWNPNAMSLPHVISLLPRVPHVFGTMPRSSIGKANMLACKCLNVGLLHVQAWSLMSAFRAFRCILSLFEFQMTSNSKQWLINTHRTRLRLQTCLILSLKH